MNMNNLKKYKIVSFDLYDTLIKRDVRKPTDVFEIVQKKMNFYNDKFDFPKDRRLAEIDLYKKKKI